MPQIKNMPKLQGIFSKGFYAILETSGLLPLSTEYYTPTYNRGELPESQVLVEDL